MIHVHTACFGIIFSLFHNILTFLYIGSHLFRYCRLVFALMGIIARPGLGTCIPTRAKLDNTGAQHLVTVENFVFHARPDTSVTEQECTHPLSALRWEYILFYRLTQDFQQRM